MKTNEQDMVYMRQAIALSIENVHCGGGPFGAVIVKDNNVVATGVNRVTAAHDPTAHAEVSAIRAAATALGTHDLTGCTIYSSCEPCPMCLSAIYWAHLDRLCYANTKEDAQSIDFDDSFIYKEIALDPTQRHLRSETLLREEGLVAFEEWKNKIDKIAY